MDSKEDGCDANNLVATSKHPKAASKWQTVQAPSLPPPSSKLTLRSPPISHPGTRGNTRRLSLYPHQPRPPLPLRLPSLPTSQTRRTPNTPRAPPATVFRTFTPPTLFPYNGLNNMPVYLAVRGRVFDVTAGRNFYGPGGPYANFAGRDASRGLACGSFDEDMLTKDLDGPLDTLGDLDAEQMEALRGWEERFEEKYLVVGKLVPVGHPEAEEKA
ncbi:hypothetical protein PTNB73_08136 [Pyrenophora teres f. teres]|nr:hypothetical protein PTNB73_08136 [Pyrenophora teres f. teres]